MCVFSSETSPLYVLEQFTLLNASVVRIKLKPMGLLEYVFIDFSAVSLTIEFSLLENDI